MRESVMSPPSAKRQPKPNAPRPPALDQGGRLNTRYFSSSVKQERRSAKLQLNAASRFDDLVLGDLVCLHADGAVVPLDPALGFAGLVEGVAEASQGFEVRLVTRCGLSVLIDLNRDSKPGDPIYAKPTSGVTQPFTMNPDGAVRVGELLAIEDAGRGRALVGIKLADDRRPFKLP